MKFILLEFRKYSKRNLGKTFFGYYKKFKNIIDKIAKTTQKCQKMHFTKVLWNNITNMLIQKYFETVPTLGLSFFCDWKKYNSKNIFIIPKFGICFYLYNFEITYTYG